MLNDGLGNLNDSSLILEDDQICMYNTIYIFLKIYMPHL